MARTKTIIAANLKQLIRFEKEEYLEEQGTEGGTAKGFRDRIIARYGEVPDKYIEALAAVADGGWREQPRKVGPDLFSIAKMTIPEYLTRSKQHYVSAADLELEDQDEFEQVKHVYATVNDLIDDSHIKLRKAGQAAAAAEVRAKQADEARRRARGDLSKFLKDLAD